MLLDTGLILNAELSLFMDDGAEGLRSYPNGRPSGAAANRESDAAFDALIDSVNRLPNVPEASP